MCGYSDAEYAGYNDTRKIMTGYIVLLNVVIIIWYLKSKENITIFVTEAKYSPVTEVCFEILFICVVLL